MKNDRFLLGILIFIGVIVVAAFVLFFLRGSTQEYLPEDSPAAIVHNYTLAVTVGDYEKGYGYLAEGDGKPSQALFRSHFNQSEPVQNVGLRVGDEDIFDTEAIVEVTVIYGSSGPFESGYSMADNARLVLQDGEWKILFIPYPYWEYGWYDEFNK